MSDVPSGSSSYFEFAGNNTFEIKLPLDFLAKLEIALWSVLTYEGCQQATLALVDSKRRIVLSSVSFDRLRRKLKGKEAPQGDNFQEIPLNFSLLNKTVVLQMSGLGHSLERKDMKRIQSLFANLESSLFSKAAAQEFQDSYTNTLKGSDHKYQNLLENMLHAVVYHDQSGRITYANPAAERILGLTQDQIFGKTSLDPDWRSIHENGKEFIGEEHPAMQALKTGKPVRNVVMGIQPGRAKKITWILINAIPELKGETTEVLQVLVTFSDISQVKEIRRRIEEKAAMLRSIIESSTESIWAVNTDFVLRYSNSKFVKLCKMLVGETIGIGDNVLDFVPIEKREFLEQSYLKAFSGEFLEFSDSYLTQQGVQHFRVNINPVFSSDRVIGATVFAKNVTELEQFMQTIKKQNERFREISWLQSHVVRAPLARLMGLMDLLLEDFSTVDSDKWAYLEKMKNASLELDKVIREINHKSEDLI
jgi:PAS domain S-box-containing protein